jgi:hypothetical protein
MPMFETYMTELNTQLSRSQVTSFAATNADRFAPGRPLDFEFLMGPDNPLAAKWKAYIGQAPSSFMEALRSVLHHAVSAQPPIPVTIAWAPGYDFELNIWQAADTAETRGGITVLIKSRYPDDRHPVR